jgi:hypothetical protein
MGYHVKQIGPAPQKPLLTDRKGRKWIQYSHYRAGEAAEVLQPR